MAELCVTLDHGEAGDRDDGEIYRAREQHLEHALELHRQFPLMDGHNDLPWAMKVAFDRRLERVDLSVNQAEVKVDNLRHGSLHTDIPRAREGGLGAQFWSVYVPFSIQGPDAVQCTIEQIDLVHRLCERYPDTFEFAHSAADVRRIFSEGRIASMCGVEGGHQINDSLGVLRMYHRLGVRYMTLTHNGGPSWADPALEKDGTWTTELKVDGLSNFGKEVVREMNRMGMIVDIAHVHMRTMEVVLEETRAPVIFSHSCSKALCDHPRDVPDHVLNMLKDNGGVIMLNFSAPFVAGAFWVRGGKVGATLLEVADHIDHIKNLIGVDYIGIGGDFDGIKNPARGLDDVSCVPYLTAELLHRGYSDEDVGKILGLNVLRVLERCEQVAQELQQQGLASEASVTDLDGPAAPVAADPTDGTN